MLRDSVCDDPSNIARCLYDGGDCCLENKDRTLCKYCTCILEVDHEELMEKFDELTIKPSENPESLDNAIGSSWTVEVEDVITSQVCTVLCLDHKRVDELNAWHYESINRICRCGWVESNLCPETMVVHNWTFDNTVQLLTSSDNVYVQLEKTVPCSK